MTTAANRAVNHRRTGTQPKILNHLRHKDRNVTRVRHVVCTR
jgi:hypothetical protein